MKSFFKVFSTIQEIFAGSDTLKIQAAVEELRAHTAQAEELEHRLAGLKSRYRTGS